MSLTNQQFRVIACQSKRAYTFEFEAREAAQMMQAKDEEEMATYQCRFCHFWHVGRVKRRHWGKRKRLVKRLKPLIGAGL